MRFPEQYRSAGHANQSGFFTVPGRTIRDTLTVIASDGLGWDHVSVSKRYSCPTWDEMAYIKGLFFEDDQAVMQLHVPRLTHVNNHPYCLHLWRPQNESIPVPPLYLV